ncbi:hypothetical protein LO771_10295 [Streptacidiphilus sp. ASG 303]|uniref:hypothetical protein n=1 Tax=Streptacidiphilus sp. ASG 303 TaxID=2896847 RepID=UPI001E2894AA|nr:hypothetical protein [Streptacidiphilus sp. ASG 303]MCD0482778.1 hypothetical protein [Streptacidiphilus sp. ASG 303]
MALTGPAGPVMNREEADRALVRLGAERDAVEAALLALQDHPGRRLLEGAVLEGRTAERWAVAEQGLVLLWSLFDRYAEALAAARAVRSRRGRPGQAELVELTGLLRGAGVAVPAGQVPPGSAADAARALAGSARPSEQLTLDGLVERMNAWCAAVADVVSAADAVRSALAARIDLLAAELQRVQALARSVGVLPGTHPAGDALDGLGAELASLRAEVARDPLALWTPGGPRPGDPRSALPGTVDTSRFDRAARALDDLRVELEGLLRVRDEADERLQQVAELLVRADATLAEARRARGEVLARIAGAEVPAVPGPASALRERVAAAAGLRRQGQWYRLAPLLDALEDAAAKELVRARHALTAVTGPLAVRAELRGRLDAYRAVAARLGLSGDPEIVERYEKARRLLWSAPCDLRAAESAVARYQQALRPVPEPAAEHRAEPVAEHGAGGPAD